MKKRRIGSLLLSLAMTVQLLSVSALAYPVPDYGPQPGTEKFQDGVPMSVSHRADWRNYPENSLLAIQSCIDMGIDVVELDVKLTSDGVVVLSHDESISRCTGVDKNIDGLTWEELREYPLKNGQGSGNPIYALTQEDAALLNGLSNYAEHAGAPAQAGDTMPLSRLDDAIELMDHQTMINLDHCFSQDRFVACYVLFRETDMLDHVFFKNSVSPETMNNWYAAAAENWNALYPEDPIDAAEVQRSILYVYIHRPGTDGSIPTLQSHLDNGDNLVMAEVCIGNDDLLAAIEDNLEPWCRTNGVSMFVNTMWSGLCGTLPDTQTTWAKMLERGYTAIQTDRPGELAVYLQTIAQDRPALETIEAEHFNSFNVDDHRFSVPAGHDGSMNKCVEKMGLGDWLSYENINFLEPASMLAVQARGLDETASLQFYLDGMTAEDRIATVTVGTSADYQSYSAELAREIPEGTYTLYVQAQGIPDRNLLNLDSFSFQSTAGLTGDPKVEEITVTTQAGVEPQLPSSVAVTYGEESYGFQVRWEQISAESYAQAGEFTVLGYVSMLQDYVTATVTVQLTLPEIPEEGLILHADATQGVEAGEDGKVSAWTLATSGGEVTATQGTDSSKPILVLDSAGNATGIRFDGSDDFLSLALDKDFFNGKSAMTAVLYTRPEQTAPTTMDTNHNISTLYLGESGDWGGMYVSAYTNGMAGRFGTGTSSYRGVLYREGSYTDATTALIKDGSTDKVWINGETVTFASTGTPAGETTKNIDAAATWLGRGKNNTYWKGALCELLIYDRALTDDELRGIALALEEKYADAVDSVQPVTAECAPGQAPELPDRVEVTYASGRTGQVGVKWAPIHPRNYQEEGTFTVSGTLLTGQTVQATVTVKAEAAPLPDDPFDPGRMLFWLSTTEGVEADGDGNVSAWSSKVNGRKATFKTNTSQKPTVSENAYNGHSGVHFSNGVLQMPLPDGSFNDLEGMTVIALAASETPLGTGSGHDAAWWSQRNTTFTVDEAGSWGSVYVGIYTDSISARFGTGTPNDSGPNGAKRDPVTGFTTTAVRWGNSTYRIDVDGETFSTTPSKGSVTKNNKATVYLGAGKDGYLWDGTICELMVFNHELTDQELEQVYTYLNDTYGTQLPVDKAEIPEDGLILHADATQGVEAGEDGKVSAWTVDASGQAVTATQTAEGSMPTVVVDKAGNVLGVRFDGSNDFLKIGLDTDYFNNKSAMTAVIYAKPEMTSPTSMDTNHNSSVLYFGEKGGGWSGLYVSAYTNGMAGRFGTGTTNYRGVLYQNGSYTDAFTTALIKDGTTDTVWINGETVGFDSVAGVTPGATTKNIRGENQTDVNGQDGGWFGRGKNKTYWKGTICEILVYDRALTDAELSGISAALAAKYTSTEQVIPVTGLYLAETGTRLELHRGDTQALEAVVLPMQADEQGILWTTSDPTVATVDETGLVTAVGLGSTAIVATTVDGGFRAYCTVRVSMRESELLWQDIETLAGWARRQDPAEYTDWADVDQALEQISTLSEESEVSELKAAYAALRSAILALEGVTLHTVTFDAMGGSQVPRLEVVSGSVVVEPAAPTRSGYRFSGWYTDEAYTQKYDFAAPVTGDMTLYAKWVRNSSSSSGSSAHVHKWAEWTVTAAPDATHEGERSRICLRCGQVETEAIPVESELEEGKVPLAGLEKLNTSGSYAYIKGFVDGTVRPQANVTRAEVVVIFYRILGRTYRELNLTAENDFPDVTAESWYNQEVSTAAKAGIIKGLPDGSFGGEREITRAEFAAIAARFLGEEEAESSGFSDISDHWAEKDIDRVAAEGWVQGKDGGIFDPDALITRAEVMAIINRILGRTAGEGLINAPSWSDNPEGTWYYEDVCLATGGPDWNQ